MLPIKSSTIILPFPYIFIPSTRKRNFKSNVFHHPLSVMYQTVSFSCSWIKEQWFVQRNTVINDNFNQNLNAIFHFKVVSYCLKWKSVSFKGTTRCEINNGVCMMKKKETWRYLLCTPSPGHGERSSYLSRENIACQWVSIKWLFLTWS